MDILRSLEPSKPESVLSEAGLFFSDHKADRSIQAQLESLYPAALQLETRAAPLGPSAWTDPDDENTAVNIYANTRLRKLRHDADERVILGDAYENRLRAQ